MSKKRVFSNLLIFIIFVIGWIGGGMFMIAMFSIGEEDNHPNNVREKTFSILYSRERASQGLRGRGIKSLVYQPETLSSYVEIEDLPPLVLPSFNDIEKTVTGLEIMAKSALLVLDWPLIDTEFGYSNYKALESMLSIYPDSEYRVLLAASSSVLTQKLDYSLSITHFTKYTKRGYKIDTIPVTFISKGYLSNIGKEYWDRNKYRCCEDSITRSKEQPYHLLTYIRLHKLWRKGGVFSDFSFFFLGQLSPVIIKHGFFINSNCKYEFKSSRLIYQSANSTFFHNSLENEYLKDSNSSGRKTLERKCITSTLLVFNEPKNDAILCILKSYEDHRFLTCIETDNVLGGAGCISDVFRECFDAAGLTNDLDTSDKSSILESFNGDPFEAQKALISSNWRLHPSKRVIWLGNLAYGSLSVNEITTLSPDSMFHKAIESISLSATVSEINNSNRRSCFKFETTGGCSPSIFIAGFSHSKSTTLYKTLIQHTSILPPLQEFMSGDTRCYSRLRVPSEELSNSNLSAITRKIHQYKEYCYPFVEPREDFRIIDASTEYSADPLSAIQIFNDNPNSKIIFVVSNPVFRMYEAYTAISDISDENLPTFEALALRGVRKLSKYGAIRQMIAKNSSNTEDILKAFFSDTEVINAALHTVSPTTALPITKARANTPSPYLSDRPLGIKESLENWYIDQLFFQSVYYPAVLHFQKLFGKNSVHVILDDEFTSVNASAKLQEIYNFIELPVFDNSQFYQPNQSSNSSSEHPFSYDLFVKLTTFFHPINIALADITGLNLSVWENVNYYSIKTGLHLERVNSNSTLPMEWYEIEDSAHLSIGSRQGIISHLLPKGKAAADAGFNTTFGMLVSF